MKAKRPQPTPADVAPNYERKCLACDQLPTVDVYVKGTLRLHTDLCGPCTWGEASAIDPENW